MSVDPYVYPGTGVLRNLLDIHNQTELDRVERRLVTQRAREGIPTGAFDLIHLQAIHRHLFQDIYDWAGKIRTVEIAKDGHQFQFMRYIDVGMANVHQRLRERDFLKGLDRRAFADASAEIIGDVNYVHPFREGNGRTQLLYLKQLAENAGHKIDVERMDEWHPWIKASQASYQGDYRPMADAIMFSLVRPRESEPDSDKDIER